MFKDATGLYSICKSQETLIKSYMKTLLKLGVSTQLGGEMSSLVHVRGGKLVCERRAESGERRNDSGELNLRHELRGKMHL